MKKYIVLLILLASFGLIACKPESKPVLNFDKALVEVNVGDEYLLSPEVTNIVEYEIEYLGYDSTIIQITNSSVKALKAGTTVITAKLKGYDDITFAITVKVSNVIASSISVSGNKEMFVGDQQQLNVAILPATVTNKTVSWVSGDDSIATVDSTGLVQAKKAGIVTISAIANDISGVVGSFEITITEKVLPLTIKIQIGKTELKENDETDISVLINGKSANSAEYTLKYDQKLATIANGKVKALAAGTLSIVATSVAQPSYSDTVTITISVKETAAESIVLSVDDDEIVIGKTTNLTVKVLPEDATNKEYTLQYNTDLATIENGVITALAGGSLVIIASLVDNPEIMEVVTVIIRVPVTTIYVDVETVWMGIGETQYIYADILPLNASDVVEWSVSDPLLASINSFGELTALQAGTVIVTATATDGSGVTGAAEVKIRPNIEEINIKGESTMYVTTNQLLNVSSATSGSLNTFLFRSENEEILTVNETGRVNAVAIGVCNIIITAKDPGAKEFKYEITVIEPIADVDIVYVSKDLVDAIPNSEVKYKGISFYVGKTAFADLSIAADVATQIIYVNEGTYEENITLSRSNISLIGPNNEINPIDGTRGSEAILSGTITIATGANDISIRGFAFTGKANVSGSGQYKNFEFKYNNVYDIAEDTAAYVFTRGATAAFLSMVNLTNTAQGENFVIENNKFANMGRCAVLVARLEGLTLRNNGFYNFARDAFRCEGGYNCKEFIIEGNDFINDELGGYNAIYFQSYSNNNGHDIHKITIENNTFKNVGQENVDAFNGAISFNTYQEEGAIINILYNRFETCVNYVHIRNNGKTTEEWAANVNYNYFKGVPYNYYHRSFNAGGSDTDGSNPPLANLDYNYFEDNDGIVITDLTAYQALFASVATCANNFQSKADYEAELKKLMGVQIDICVNSAWIDAIVNDTVTYDGFTYTIGVDAFADLDQALAVATSGQRIFVAAGNYEKEYTINTSNITIFGPNEVVNPNLDNRLSEATFTNIMKINSGISGVTIQGVRFTKAGRIMSGDDGGNKDITIAYVLFDSQITTSGAANGLIHMVALLENGNSNLVINNCRVESTSLRTIAMFIDGMTGLTVKNSYFEGTVSTFNDCIKLGSANGVSGDILFEGNEFRNVAQYTIWILTGGLINGKFDVIGNVFEKCGDHDNAYLRACVTVAKVVNTDSHITYINVLKNTFTDVDLGVRVQVADDSVTVDNLFVTVKENLFNSWRHVRLIVNNSSVTVATKDLKVINAEYNYFGQPISDALFMGVSSYANQYENASDVPPYVKENEVKPTSLVITNKIDEIDAYDTYQVYFEVGPNDATNKKVLFTSSDPNVASISSAGLITTRGEGTITITVTTVANGLTDTFTFRIAPISRIEATYPGNGVIVVGEQEQITTDFIENINNETLSYSSSDETIATVSQTGLVSAVGSGNVIITITSSSSNLTTEVGFTVLTAEEYNGFSDLMKKLIDANSGVVLNQNIVYIGSDDGSADYMHNINGAVNAYYAGILPETVRNMLPTDRANYSNETMKSVEFVVVHDTAGSPSTSTAYNNSHWCTNPSNTETSWHYTIGNDGVYQQLEDNIIGYHAGDGTTWADTTTFYDTGVKATVVRPEVTLGSDGYFYIEGTQSIIKYPAGAVGIVEVGVLCVIGENGNYFLPVTHLTTKNLVAVRGGNLNGIGIETAVNMGSDVYLTWQMTAKFSAGLLVKHNLGLDRISFHNNYSGKICPRTMMTANLTDVFLEMVAMEYEIQKNYSDYKIEFRSNNPEIIDNSGRVVANPEYTANVTYTITITSPSDVVEEITLNAIVIGRYNY